MTNWTTIVPINTGWHFVRWGPTDATQRIYVHGVWFDYEHTQEWIGPTWSDSETGSLEYLDPIACRSDGTLFAREH